MCSARVAFALVCLFIVYNSIGDWAPYQPAIWAPFLVSVPDVIENVSIYVLFGALAAWSAGNPHERHWSRRAVKIGVLAVLFSAVNEAMQLYTTDRVASLTDIVSAAIGGVGGAAIVSLRTPR